MKILVTGGCGFVGSNVSMEIIKRGDELTIFDNLSRTGSTRNLEWLKKKGGVKFIYGDIRNREDVEIAIKDVKPDVIFHLAGQVAMTNSIKNPRIDFEINAFGSLNILETIRNYSPESIVVYSSTNKVYGDLLNINYDEDEKRYRAIDFPNGFSENMKLDFRSPYGVSKGCADQYMLDYYRIFGIKTVVFRHSSIYGPRQFATFDQGWLGWFCQKALGQQKGISNNLFTVAGDGKQVRDVLYVEDLVKLYLDSVKHLEKLKGQAFNIGGQMENSLSILELFDLLECELKIRLNYKKISARISDQKVFVADIGKINKLTDWRPQIDKITGIRKMLVWLDGERNADAGI